MQSYRNANVLRQKLYLGIHLRRVVQRLSHTRRFRSPFIESRWNRIYKGGNGNATRYSSRSLRMNQMQVAIIESRGKIRMFRELERETARRIFGGGLRGTLLE